MMVTLHSIILLILFYFHLLSSIAGGAVSRVDPESTGLNPSWRKAVTEVYVVASWPEGSTVDFIFQQIDGLKQSTLILDKLTTDSGSYLNEVTNPWSLRESKLVSLIDLFISFRLLLMNLISRNLSSAHITIN